MNVLFHKQFEKQYRKLPAAIQKQFMARLRLFTEDPKHPLLHVHMLTGNKFPYQSLNVNADIRALFIQEKTKVTFYEIGSHSELYAK
jgi:mRNA-degrading endonuclease YafQ of YafQ-DinJ toxin-antitoxin module